MYELTALSYTPNDSTLYQPLSITFSIKPQCDFQLFYSVVYTIDSSNTDASIPVTLYESQPISVTTNNEQTFTASIDFQPLKQYDEHKLYNVATFSLIIFQAELQQFPTGREIAAYTSVVAAVKPDFGVDIHRTIYSPL